jgi:beta-glucosidase/6-phospho-beta-glucosidase/beta-galactosidase
MSTLSNAEKFFIGTATSSYQIEGWNKGESIWDNYTTTHHLHPVGNATNFFSTYKNDIALMNQH